MPVSWLGRAERETDEPDAAFILPCIALNAAYSHEFGFEEGELVQTRRFIASVNRKSTWRAVQISGASSAFGRGCVKTPPPLA